MNATIAADVVAPSPSLFILTVARCMDDGVGVMACWVEEGTSTNVMAMVVVTVVGVFFVVMACWVEGTSTDVVDGVTDGHTSSISCTTVPAVCQRCFIIIIVLSHCLVLVR